MWIAICDDNPLFLAEIRKQVEELHMTEPPACFSDLHAFWASVEEGVVYDAVLMDIDWRQSETGMDAAERLSRLSPRTRIIYVTGYNDRFSQQIFLHRANLCGYLVKPVDSRILRANLEKVEAELVLQEEAVLTVSSRGKPVSIPHRDIFYIESMGHTIRICTAEETAVVYERLDAVQKMLPPGFIRCHKSYIVNMRQIRRFQPPDILLKNGMSVPVSRKRYAETKEAYFKFMGQTF